MKKLIGSGTFTKCYKISDNEVELISNCAYKECMSFGWFPESRLFPTIKRLEGYINEKGDSLYRMKFYERQRSLKNTLKPTQYTIYKTLRETMQNIKHSANIYDSYKNTFEGFSTLKNKALRGIMLEALDACSNYGSDVGFEISPRNVAADNGNLILLDVFYSKKALKALRSR